VSYALLHHWSEAARSSILRDRSRSRRIFVVSEIAAGWLVVDAEGQGVGRVAGLEGDFLAVSRGFVHPRLYVPLLGVREVTEGKIRLNLTVDQIGGSRWAERPRTDR
jgi:hypothetical protein